MARFAWDAAKQKAKGQKRRTRRGEMACRGDVVPLQWLGAKGPCLGIPSTTRSGTAWELKSLPGTIWTLRHEGEFGALAVEVELQGSVLPQVPGLRDVRAVFITTIFNQGIPPQPLSGSSKDRRGALLCCTRYMTNLRTRSSELALNQNTRPKSFWEAWGPNGSHLSLTWGWPKPCKQD